MWCCSQAAPNPLYFSHCYAINTSACNLGLFFSYYLVGWLSALRSYEWVFDFYIAATFLAVALAGAAFLGAGLAAGCRRAPTGSSAGATVEGSAASIIADNSMAKGMAPGTPHHFGAQSVVRKSRHSDNCR